MSCRMLPMTEMVKSFFTKSRAISMEMVNAMFTIRTWQDPWQQRTRFRDLADAWMESHTDGPQAERRATLAQALEISPDSLKQYYSGRQVPGAKLRGRMVRVLQCRPIDLWDDPDLPMAGIDPEEWSSAEEDARTFANIMFHEAKDLTPEERKAILAMVRAGRALGQARKGK